MAGASEECDDHTLAVRMITESKPEEKETIISVIIN